MLHFHDILNLNPDNAAYGDISQAGSEHIRGVLLRTPDGFPVLGAGFFLLLDDSLDEARADVAAKGYDGARFIKWKGVFRAGNWGLGGVVEEGWERGAGRSVVDFCD